MATASLLPARPQPGVLGPVATLARSLTFRTRHKTDPTAALQRLVSEMVPEWGTIGIGEQLALHFGRSIDGLRTFPALSGPDACVPSTQAALWIFVRGEEYTELYQREGKVRAMIRDAFAVDDAANTFFYDKGRDLSGFEDGTENPKGDDAVAAAIVASGPLAGSSFVAVQRWIHDLEGFAAFNPHEAGEIIGRDLVTNEELEDAPLSAHVKRTAQESFEPAAFMHRRSMPWSNGEEHGLEFIAYVDALEKFDVMMRRMIGLDDGITDGLFTFSRPLTGGYYWIPPVRNDRVDLSALGL